ncbi:MAG: DNA utilization protein GntX [Firmicutes bacterium ADurb.Bin193]|nr:MAG: DNA utilization protein GntX [Firmicutes bacterium ADurb.Bin193]
MKLLRLLSNFFSPPLCIFCRNPLDIESEDNICPRCKKDIPLNNKKSCRICATPLDISFGDLYCGVCRKGKRAFAQTVSRYVFKDGVAAAVRYMKFGKGQIWIADTLGRLVAKTVLEEYQGIKFDMVVYVPISKKRMRERGFNQSEIIAEAVCKELGLAKPSGVLQKLYDTPRQSGLKLKERRGNVKGAFGVKNGSVVEDKTVLLIDDICTTGATLDECSRVLKKAGATVVYCATAATTALGR